MEHFGSQRQATGNGITRSRGSLPPTLALLPGPRLATGYADGLLLDALPPLRFAVAPRKRLENGLCCPW